MELIYIVFALAITYYAFYERPKLLKRKKRKEKKREGVMKFITPPPRPVY